MKKILFIITQSEFGGAQKYVYSIATRLNNKKYQVVVAAGPEGDWELFSRLKKENVEIRKLRFLRRAVSPLFDLMGFFQIYRLLKKERPDIVYLHSSKAGALGSMAVAFYRGISRIFCGISRKNFNGNPRDIHVYPRVIYRIGGWVFNEKKSFIKKWIYVSMERFTARFKDIIVVNSQFDKMAAITRKICAENKLRVIYNGIEADSLGFLLRRDARQILFQSISRDRQSIVNGQQLVVGAIANFYSNKGLAYLIEAARILDNDKLLFVIIGEGAEREKLEDLIKKYNLRDRFLLRGNVCDAYKYLKAFDVFVLPSLKEGMPWAILEAMAASLPIVATKVGGVPEMIESGKSGILVESQNAEKLAEAIKRVINDETLKNNLKINALKVVKSKFSFEEMFKKTEELF